MKSKHKWQTQEVWIMKRLVEDGETIDRKVSVGEQLTYRNVFAVHKIEDSKLWQITHIPTGYKFEGLAFATRRDAISYGEWLCTLSIIWKDITKDNLLKQMPRISRIKMREKAREYEAI